MKKILILVLTLMVAICIPVSVTAMASTSDTSNVLTFNGEVHEDATWNYRYITFGFDNWGDESGNIHYQFVSETEYDPIYKNIFINGKSAYDYNVELGSSFHANRHPQTKVEYKEGDSYVGRYLYPVYISYFTYDETSSANNPFRKEGLSIMLTTTKKSGSDDKPFGDFDATKHNNKFTVSVENISFDGKAVFYTDSSDKGVCLTESISAYRSMRFDNWCFGDMASKVKGELTSITKGEMTLVQNDVENCIMLNFPTTQNMSGLSNPPAIKSMYNMQATNGWLYDHFYYTGTQQDRETFIDELILGGTKYSIYNYISIKACYSEGGKITYRWATLGEIMNRCESPAQCDCSIIVYYDYNDKTGISLRFNLDSSSGPVALTEEIRVKFHKGFVSDSGYKLNSDMEFAFNEMEVEDGVEVDVNAFSLTSTETGYSFLVPFNRSGENTQTPDVSGHIYVNNIKLKNLPDDYSVEWTVLSRYYLTINVGSNIIKNQSNGLIGNCLSLKEGLMFPDGSTLEGSYNIKTYAKETLLETADVDNEKTLEISEVKIWNNNENSTWGVNIIFNEEIVGDVMYYASAPESFKVREVKPLNGQGGITFYDEDLSQMFIYSGCKSVLLDKILLCGVSIGEWLATDQSLSNDTAVLVHYGQYDKKTITISFDLNSYIESDFYFAHSTDSLTVKVLDGFFVPSGLQVKRDAEYRCVGNLFREITYGDLQVSYDGQDVAHQGKVVTNAPIDKEKIVIVGGDSNDIEIQETKNGDVAYYTIYTRDIPVYTFEVEYKPVENTKGGCSSGITVGVFMPLVLLGAVMIITRRKRSA